MKHILRQDERTILKCISPEIGYIGRMTCGNDNWLYISKGRNYHEWSKFYVASDLFQFIEDDEEYSIEELLEEKNDT